MGSGQVSLHGYHECVRVKRYPPSKKGGPEGSKAQLNPWCEQPSGGNCKQHEKTLTNLNDEQTPKRESEGSPQWTPNQRLTPRYKKPRDQSIDKKEMGDRSAISTSRDTLGKQSRAYDNAHNVKDFKGRAVDGNATPRRGVSASVVREGVARISKSNY